MSKLVLVVRDVDGPKQLLRSLLVVHELALGTRSGVQYFVPVLQKKKYMVINRAVFNLSS